jgi:hypothetical protein
MDYFQEILMEFTEEEQEGLKDRIKRKANHGILGCSQRLSGIIKMELPQEVFEKELIAWHKEVQEFVKLINEL